MAIFSDRIEAGQLLADKLAQIKSRLVDPIVLGIPRGGVPIGSCIAKAIGAPLDVIVLRKLPIPDNPEAGFGAVTIDKVTIFNESMAGYLGLNEKEINGIVERVYKEVLRREKVYRKNRPFPPLAGRSVILTDDGLATGITMLAAVKFAWAKMAKEIIIAVPVAHQEAFDLLKKEADRVIVLHVDNAPFFAVASFYREFTDMKDEEVISYL